MCHSERMHYPCWTAVNSSAQDQRTASDYYFTFLSELCKRWACYVLMCNGPMMPAPKPVGIRLLKRNMKRKNKTNPLRTFRTTELLAATLLIRRPPTVSTAFTLQNHMSANIKETFWLQYRLSSNDSICKIMLITIKKYNLDLPVLFFKSKWRGEVLERKKKINIL